MSDFFHGWKCKAGFVTLVISCLFMAGWLRSDSRMDTLRLNGSTWSCIVFSVDDCLWFFSDTASHSDGPLINWQARPVDQSGSPGTQISRIDRRSSRIRPMDEVETSWHWRWREFMFGSGALKDAPSLRLKFISIPYWSVVIPLALLSAYLLFNRPRSRHPKNALEAVTAEGS